MVRYGRALREMKELVAKSGHNPDAFALHSLRTGGATNARGRGRHIGTSDSHRREVEVRLAQSLKTEMTREECDIS